MQPKTQSNPILWLKYKFLEWKWDRILKKSNHSSWEQYLRWNDPDFDIRGRTIKQQFFGYPHVAVVGFKHLDSTVDPMWGEIWNGKRVDDWCNSNCRGKYRWHWERVIMDHMGQYEPNGIGGTDELFFGFKDERDYMLFLLRWS
jgi:hypothetical protein